MLRTLRAFWHDQRGVALILVSIMLPAIIGFSLLVIDMSRANNLHNDLQKAADAFALAAAAELDGKDDALVRAERAMANLVKNDSRFSSLADRTHLDNGGVVVGSTGCPRGGDLVWCFLRSIPASDATAIDPETGIDTSPSRKNHTAQSAAEAQFIMVSIRPSPFAAIFSASFLSGNAADNSFDVAAQAVAGFKRSICEVTPMFMCNPFESDGLSFQKAFSQGKLYSRELRLLKADSQPGPGNFGLLQTELALRTAFAIGSAGTCYLRAAVETKPGVTLGHVNAGLNVRFDIYSGSLKKFDANRAYRPASNVRKGASNPNNCNKFSSAVDGSAMGFPAGDYASSEQLGLSGDSWNRDGYWALNHVQDAAMPNIPSSSHPTSTSMPPSRYDVYRYEIAQQLVGDKAGGKNKGETGVPQCYKGPTSTITADPDRRLFNVAVVNCVADAGKIAGRTALRPDAYASVFLTNPIEKDNAKDDDESETGKEKPVRLEVVDVEGPMGNGSLDNFLRDEAQLYR